MLGCLKDRLWLEYPEAVVDLKRVDGLSGVEEHAGGLRVGAMTTLTEVAESERVRALYPALARGCQTHGLALVAQYGYPGRQYLPAEPLLVLPLPR